MSAKRKKNAVECLINNFVVDCDETLCYVLRRRQDPFFAKKTDPPPSLFCSRVYIDYGSYLTD